MTQITINGHDYNMAYNLATAIAYERMTGHNPLDLEQFNKTQIDSIASIAYCMILSNNDPDKVPEYSEFISSISDASSLTELFNAAGKEMQSFFAISKADKKPTKAKKGDDSKNS